MFYTVITQMWSGRITGALIYPICRFCSCAHLAWDRAVCEDAPPPTWAKANLIRQAGLRITLPQSISLPPGEKGQPSLPPLFHLKPSTPPLRPSALHLSRGSLQSQDNLETPAGPLPETLKKFPPSLFFFFYPHLSCTPPPNCLSSPPPDH